MAFRWKKMDYVSEIDQHFEHWNQSMTLSPSQKMEIAKYEKINDLRDNAKPEDKTSDTSD